jgi:hypothetical protein
VRHSWNQLVEIADVLIEQMSANPYGTLVSATPDVASNAVETGFTNVLDPAAIALSNSLATPC